MTSHTRGQDVLRLSLFSVALAALSTAPASAQGAVDDTAGAPATAKTQTLGSVQVRARRPESATGSHVEALLLKKEPPNIVDVQPLSKIRKLPDVNTAEAMQRVPGISLETDSGEGRFVNIRGLNADLSSVTYGGVRLPPSNVQTTFGGERAVALDTVLTGLVGGLLVTKTNRPDQDAEALGGTVDLAPRSGAEHGSKPFAEIRLGGGVEPLRGTPVANFSATVGSSFGLGGIGSWFQSPDAFSALLTATYYDQNRGVDDTEADYSDQQSAGAPDKLYQDVDLRYYQGYRRSRYGLGGEFDARGNENNSFYLSFLVSSYTERKHAWHLAIDGLDSGCDTSVTPANCSAAVNPADPNGFIAPSATVSHRLEDNLERIQTNLTVLGGKSTFGVSTLDYHASFAEGVDHVPYAFGSTTFTNTSPVPIAYNNISDPRFPTFQTTNGSDLNNPANFQLTKINQSRFTNRDRQFGQALNDTIPLKILSDADELKFGVQLLERKHSYHQSETNGQPVAGTPPILLSQLQLGLPVTTYDNRYAFGGIPNRYQLRDIFGNPALISLSTDPAADAANTTSASEDVYAFYAQYSTRILGKLGVLAGARGED